VLNCARPWVCMFFCAWVVGHGCQPSGLVIILQRFGVDRYRQYYWRAAMAGDFAVLNYESPLPIQLSQNTYPGTDWAAHIYLSRNLFSCPKLTYLGRIGQSKAYLFSNSALLSSNSYPATQHIQQLNSIDIPVTPRID